MRHIAASLALATASVLGAVEPATTVARATIAPLVTADPADPAWHGVATIALGPCLGQPADGLPATTAALLWEPGFLHVRYRCTDTAVVPAAADRDPYTGDAVELFLDPVGDARLFIEFQGGADGRVWDQLWLLTVPARSGADGVLAPEIMGRDQWSIPRWGCNGLRFAAHPLPGGDGWIADLAVPAKPVLRRLGLDAFAPMRLRADLLRLDYRHIGDASPSLLAWAPVVPGRPHRSPQAYGELQLVQ